jgi:integrase
MARGVYEKVPGSGVWWIQYFEGGKRHREKVGAKSAAIKLYQTRKADATAGRKMPTLRNTRGITVGDLLDDALEYAAHHKDFQNYKSRAEIVRGTLGDIAATDLTPLDLKRWLNAHCKTPATANRYKSLVSLAYRVGGEAGKVTVNPARMVFHRPEPAGRKRYLMVEEKEYDRLYAAIMKLYPEHLAEFIVSVYTGMRLTEQYSCEWSQVSLSRKTIELTVTKNGFARTVRLNEKVVAAIESLRRPGQKKTDLVFPSTRKDYVTDTWFHPCLAEAGITGYVWHCNRHTFCSWLAMAGATDRQIMEAAGHKSLAMAAKYSHLSPRHTQSVVDML